MIGEQARQRAHDAEDVLTGQEREDDEDRMDLRGVAHDLRVQEVRLDLVDADDPGEDEERGA
ncbi:MAG: hypothetical protein R3B82_29210 [Sandaracinaceae bacterium]